MKIVLSTSPHIRHAAVLESDFQPNHGLMYTFVPVGLLSLIGALRIHRPRDVCTLFDLNRRIISNEVSLSRMLYDELAREIVANDPDVVGFMTECDSYHHILQVASSLKSRRPRCKIVLGGPHASVVAAETLQAYKCIDAVVVGEGEVTFPELLASFEQDNESPVLGVVRRLNSGEIVDGGPRDLIAVLDELPMPAYDLYIPAAGEEVFLEVGRGCPFQCEFCSTAPYWHRKHRVKSPGRISTEIDYLHSLYGVRRIHFTHDLFTTNRNWVVQVCDRLISDGKKIRWTCSARTDTVDKPLLGMMKSAGCDAIYFGIESGSPRILKAIKKDIPLEQSFRVLSECKELGITPNVGFIVGFPQETAATLEETFQAYESTLRQGCKPAHLFAFNPFVGSSMYSKLGEIDCDGHFVDLPLGAITDLMNRQKISSEPELFRSFYRPRLPDLIPGCTGALGALDEFSPLVEAALFPALSLGGTIGGLYKVFSRWLEWIKRTNAARGAAEHRSGYGSPVLFATFLVEMLEAETAARADALEAAQVLKVSFSVGERFTAGNATTMASYRSLATHQLAAPNEVRLGSALASRNVIALLETSHDVRPVLRGDFVQSLALSGTYLVWHATEDGSVRVLDVDEPTFGLLRSLFEGPQTAGALVLERVSRNASIDPSLLVEALSSLAREGVISVGQSL